MKIPSVAALLSTTSLFLATAHAAPVTPTTSEDIGIAKGARALAEILQHYASPANWSLSGAGHSGKLRTYELGRIATMKRVIRALDRPLVNILSHSELELGDTTRAAIMGLTTKARIVARGDLFLAPEEFGKMLGMLASQLREKFPREQASGLGRWLRRPAVTNPAAHDLAYVLMSRAFQDAVVALEEAVPPDLGAGSVEQETGRYLESIGIKLKVSDGTGTREFWKGVESLLPEFATLIERVQTKARETLEAPAPVAEGYGDVARVTRALRFKPALPEVHEQSGRFPVELRALETLQHMTPLPVRCGQLLTRADAPMEIERFAR